MSLSLIVGILNFVHRFVVAKFCCVLKRISSVSGINAEITPTAPFQIDELYEFVMPWNYPFHFLFKTSISECNDFSLFLDSIAFEWLNGKIAVRQPVDITPNAMDKS